MPNTTKPFYLPESKLGASQKAALHAVMTVAKKDPFLATPDDSVIREGEVRMAILHGGDVIGFFSPKRQSFKGQTHWRAGALYLLPIARGHGFMAMVLRDFFATHSPALSWIDDTNAKSIAVFTKLGFVKDKPRAAQDGGQGHWYVLAKSALTLEDFQPGTKPAFTSW